MSSSGFYAGLAIGFFLYFVRGTLPSLFSHPQTAFTFVALGGLFGYLLINVD